MSYRPPAFIPRFDSEEFRQFLREEFGKIATASIVTRSQVLALQPLAVAPAKPRQGFVVYADGTNWNPGSGEGVYRYDGTTWNFLG